MGVDGLRADLEALISSPGWQWLALKAKIECSTQKDAGIRAAANEVEDQVALNKLRQVLAFELGVEKVLNMPLEQLQHLRLEEQRTTTGFDPSRRGPL